MGMFDHVLFETDCWGCGAKLDDFQTKDGECALMAIPPNGLDSFYTGCDRCGLWVEYTWNAETGQPEPNYKAMFAHQGHEIRLLRKQLFALCERMDVPVRHLVR